MTGLKIGSPSWRAHSLGIPRKLLLIPVLVSLCLILNTVGAGAQTGDDHGNFLSNATNLPLGSSIAGRIDPSDDRDIFRLDLSGRVGNTDVWVFTTGELDTLGGLHNSAGTLIVYSRDGLISPNWDNFHIRRNLSPGLYYIQVVSEGRQHVGSYTLHAKAVTDPGSNTGTAAPLNLDTPSGGSVDTASDADYFRIDLAADMNLILYGRGLILRNQERYLLPLEPFEGELFDAANSPVSVNVFSAGRLGFTIRDNLEAGTYYVRVTTPPGVESHPVPYTIHMLEDAAYTQFINNCENIIRPSQIDDPLYGCQWHLNNPIGEDINIEPVWAEGITGEGVNIAVVDDGMDWSHEDLVDNVDASLNHDYYGRNDIHHPFEHHGTNVAGVLAARDNDIGVRGIAPQVTIYGYNLTAPGRSSFFHQADAMDRNSRLTAVSNSSWGPPGGPELGTANMFWHRAVETGVKVGFGGNGTFYVFAGGNAHMEGDNSNLNEYANHYGVTAVCAVNDDYIRSTYSEMGANLWVCAPSNDDEPEHRGIVTVENSDRYRADFGGTSAATPIVSGVAALMRQANPNLTWRDLKLILAASASKNDPTNPGWEDGAGKYGSTSATDLYRFNHEYGFGVVDAKAAVDLAKGWTNAPPLQNVTAESGSLNLLIPDALIFRGPTTVSDSLTLNTDISFTEFVEVNVSIQHTSFRDVGIELKSPSGAVSKLTVPFDTFADDDPDTGYVSLHGEFRFGSARHLGEDPNGTWELSITDDIPTLGGYWDSWEIKVYGHTGTPVSTSACVTGGAVANTSSNPGLVLDCETLLEMRDTLVGTGTSLNWSSRTPMSTWDGVTMEGTPPRVTQLSLWNRGLRGTIPVQLGNLSALTVLDLSTPTCDGLECPDLQAHERNQLTGTIPVTLGNLASLQELNLHNNQLTGEVPQELSRLSNLQVLALGLNQLSGTVPPQLGSLSNLSQLYLWGNQLTGTIPAQLGSIANLERLELAQNQLSGTIPTTIGDLTNLEHLVLWENRLSGTIPTELGNLSHLKVLSLQSNQLTGSIPASLAWLASLETLYLSRNQFVGCIPAGLQNVPSNDLANVSLPFCVQPSVTLSKTSPDAPIRLNSVIQVTATFSEPVTGFEMADVVVANGIVSSFVGADGDSVFTFDVTPNAIGVVTVDVPQDAAVDSESNGNTAAAQLRLGMPYDDDNDGFINGIEVLNGVRDYFVGILTGQQVLELVRLYFSSPG